VTVSDSASPATQFLTSDLGGKEVWHITAPSNMSMKAIKPFIIRAAMRGEPILNSEGKEYCLKEGLSANTCTLIPNDITGAYVPGTVAVSRTFHLQEMINPPTKDKRSEDNQPEQMYFEFQPHDGYPVRKKRKQPEGLRVRYKPFGTSYASQEQPDAGRPDISLPNEMSLPGADHRAGRKKKSRENWRSSRTAPDPDVMELDPPQTPSATHQGSPKSREPSKVTFSGKNVAEASSVMQEKIKKKRRKKNKPHGAEST
jgi:hypothetical protein